MTSDSDRTIAKRPRLRHYRREDLEPLPGVARAQRPNLLSLDSAESGQLEEFCRRFSHDGEYEFDRSAALIPGHLRMFVAMLAALGAVQISRRGDSMSVRQTGRLARHVPRILEIYLEKQYALIDNWGRSGALHEDRLNAVTFVHQLEIRRIELERSGGYIPEPLAERPVAFGVFRAIDSRGRSSYLFEINKDWHRLNFIGGKQEPVDRGDFHATLRREISEELGIAPVRVTLTRLNDNPIVSYGLSGNAGSLARYPCVLFGVSVDEEFGIRPQDGWITEDTIRRYMSIPDCPIMVHPEYMAFLLSGSPSRLERCPLTTSAIVSSADQARLPQAERRNWVGGPRVTRETTRNCWPRS